ncbi:MAG: gamma-glutamyltransferase family protein [Sphingomicrobium sp.]
MKLIPRLVLTLAAMLASAAPASAHRPPPQTAQPFAIAANPLAARAGLAVLKRGGSAVDAAVAMQAMLSLVEPQSSGLGGGAFMNFYNGRTHKLTIYDGRETAPAQASEAMFLGPDGKALPFNEAVLSGRATGVPGAVRMLDLAHSEHGRLAWSTLFGDARRTARNGFIISPRLGRFIASDFAENHAPDVAAYFSGGTGKLLASGERLRNPAYAAFLARLAAHGPSALYAGSTAAKIVARTRAAPLGGSMTMADLAAYRPVKREALCRLYRAYRVCAPPPPSSGVGLLQLLALLEPTDIARRGPSDPQSWYLFAEASRLMYADRDRYVGDVAGVPIAGLLDPAYVASRRALIGPVAWATPPVAGTPPMALQTAPDTTREPAGTSHFIVGDAAGNVVSITTTVESIFGSGRMVDGFFLNNQMTDFALAPRDASGLLSVNAVAPGKRPRSSMVPTILLDARGNFAGAVGSAGGNSILAYVAKTIVGAVDWGLPMQQAIALPNLVARGPNWQGEVSKFPPEVLTGLAARGITLKPGQGEDSGIQGGIIRNGKIDGGFDPRREGVVLTLPAKR